MTYVSDAQQRLDQLDGLGEDLAGRLDHQVVLLADLFEVLLQVELFRRGLLRLAEQLVQLGLFFLQDGGAGLHALRHLLRLDLGLEGLQRAEHVVVSQVLRHVLVDLVDCLVVHDYYPRQPRPQTRSICTAATPAPEPVPVSVSQSRQSEQSI